MSKGRLSKQIAGDIGISDSEGSSEQSDEEDEYPLRAEPGRIADKLELLSEKT